MYQLVLTGDTLAALHAELAKALAEIEPEIVALPALQPEPLPEPQPEPRPEPQPTEVPMRLAITLSDLREVLRTLRDKKGRSAIQQVLARFKAETVPDIKEADYADAVFYAQELYNAE